MQRRRRQRRFTSARRHQGRAPGCVRKWPEVPPATDGGASCSVDASALTLSSSITANSTLAAGCVYKVTSNITIAGSAMLTVEPGVRVEFAKVRV